MSQTKSEVLKAVVIGNPSKIMTKSNGSAYVLINCEIIEGRAKGAIVAGTRTIVTRDGEEKEVPVKGQEIVLYRRVLPSTTEEGKFVNFFEIGTSPATTSNDELNALLGIDNVAVVNTTTSQTAENV